MKTDFFKFRKLTFQSNLSGVKTFINPTFKNTVKSVYNDSR